jgi:hypothetical protein
MTDKENDTHECCSRWNLLVVSFHYHSSLGSRLLFWILYVYLYDIFIYTGKPTMLESKFRLTYSMILNLFRVEKISVEGMMLHSFKECGYSQKHKKFKKELESVEKRIEEISLNIQQHGPHWQPLSHFYDIAAKYLELRSKVIVCCFLYILFVHNNFHFLKYIVRTLNWVRFYC